ncbi:hypothetical protein GQ600_12751 [Phytophthora cactorum]|nr:hypothetical protein GQ600_12751 [Phytophthora cactorum]
MTKAKNKEIRHRTPSCRAQASTLGLYLAGDRSLPRLLSAALVPVEVGDHGFEPVLVLVHPTNRGQRVGRHTDNNAVTTLQAHAGGTVVEDQRSEAQGVRADRREQHRRHRRMRHRATGRQRVGCRARRCGDDNAVRSDLGDLQSIAVAVELYKRTRWATVDHDFVQRVQVSGNFTFLAATVDSARQTRAQGHVEAPVDDTCEMLHGVLGIKRSQETQRAHGQREDRRHALAEERRDPQYRAVTAQRDHKVNLTLTLDPVLELAAPRFGVGQLELFVHSRFQVNVDLLLLVQPRSKPLQHLSRIGFIGLLNN